MIAFSHDVFITIWIIEVINYHSITLTNTN